MAYVRTVLAVCAAGEVRLQICDICDCAGVCLRIVVCSAIGSDVGVDALEFFFRYVRDRECALGYAGGVAEGWCGCLLECRGGGGVVVSGGIAGMVGGWC